MAHWTFDDISDQTGRIAVVTGAHTGIGPEAARMIAQKGAREDQSARNRRHLRFRSVLLGLPSLPAK